MEAKICELLTNIDMIKEAQRTVKKAVLENVNKVIMQFVCEPSNASLVRSDITVDHYNEEAMPCVNFEIGFLNSNENKFDFGSDVWFTHNPKDGLKINYGTIGSFGKDETYQFLRIKLLNHVVDNIEKIETELSQVEVEFNNFLKYNEERYELERELHDIFDVKKKNQLAEIQNSLVPGMRLSYNRDVKRHEKLFPSVNCDSWMIKKINPKTLRINRVSDDYSVVVNKETFIKQIYGGLIELEK